MELRFEAMLYSNVGNIILIRVIRNDDSACIWPMGRRLPILLGGQCLWRQQAFFDFLQMLKATGPNQKLFHMSFTSYLRTTTNHISSNLKKLSFYRTFQHKWLLTECKNQMDDYLYKVECMVFRYFFNCATSSCWVENIFKCHWRWGYWPKPCFNHWGNPKQITSVSMLHSQTKWGYLLMIVLSHVDCVLKVKRQHASTVTISGTYQLALTCGTSAVARVSEAPPEISSGAPHTLLAYYYELQ